MNALEAVGSALVAVVSAHEVEFLPYPCSYPCRQDIDSLFASHRLPDIKNITSAYQQTLLQTMPSLKAPATALGALPTALGAFPTALGAFGTTYRQWRNP